MDPRTAALTFCLLLLCACGGGGGDGSSAPPTPRTVSGTVAANTALAGYDVDVLAPSAPSGTTVDGVGGTTGADGRYSVTTDTTNAFAVPPVLVRAGGSVVDAEPQYQRLYSIATRGGTVNVTPLTSLLVARLLNRKPEFGADVRAVFELQNRSDADLSAAQQQVVAYLLSRPSKDNGNFTRPVDVSAVTDFISMPLTAAPGNPHFEALRRLHASLMDSETIEGVEEHMLFGNDPAADLRAILSLDFLANCTVVGADNRTLPRDSTRIIVDSSGITFGDVHLPFEAGTRLNLTAGQTLDNRWRFNFPTPQASVDFSIAEDRLRSALLSLPFMGSRCTPSSAVSVSGKHPSLMALIGRLRQSISGPAFQCTAAVIPGFRPDTNFLSLDANGALRINGLGGPSLHLPSLNIEINAPLVPGGQLAPLRFTTFAASRVLRGGFDVFTVRLTDGGQIIGLSLDRKNEQSNQAQNCGLS
jgi:hypothetical protein